MIHSLFMNQSKSSALILALHRGGSRPRLPRLDWQASMGFWLTFAKVPFSMLAVSLASIRNLSALSALIGVTVVFDILDGYVFNCSAHASNRPLRELRRVWDSLLDRVFIFAVLIPALLIFQLPLYVFAVIVVREIFIWIITGLPYVRTGFVHKPNLPSKIGAALAGAEVIYFNITSQISLVILFAFVVLSAIGILLYLLRPQKI